MVSVSNGYFDTLGVKVIQGRAFNREDGMAGHEAVLVAAGKVLLAHLPEEEVERVCRAGLTGATKHTITSPDRLREHLSEIRRRGFAVNPGEWHLDACGVAVPLLNHTGYAVAAIGVACSAARFSPEWVERVAPPALDHARDISAALGYRGSSAGRLAIP